MEGLENYISISNLFNTGLIFYLAYLGKVLTKVDKNMIAIQVKVKHNHDEIERLRDN